MFKSQPCSFAAGLLWGDGRQPGAGSESLRAAGEVSGGHWRLCVRPGQQDLLRGAVQEGASGHCPGAVPTPQLQTRLLPHFRRSE